MDEFKIYKFEGDETDWICARTEERAIEVFNSHHGNAGEPLGDIELTEVTDNELRTSYILDINELEPEDEDFDEEEYFNGYKIKRTLYEEMKDAKFSHFVCTTDF